MNDADKVDELVRRFSRMLAATWPDVAAAGRFSQTGSFEIDWLQGLWERFVEGALLPGCYLLEYGEGADCNGASSRVWLPDVLPTHVVTCLPRSETGEMLDLISQAMIRLEPTGVPLDELVSQEGTWYARKPPFDCVLVEVDDEPRLFRLDDVRFALRQYLR